MGFIERIEAAIGGEEDDEVETIVEGQRSGGDDRERSRTGARYRCGSCGAKFDAPKPSCPRCGNAELYDASG